MNENALILASYVFKIGFVFSLLVAILVIRSEIRRRRTESERKKAQAAAARLEDKPSDNPVN